jgi:hypothetical protein
MMPRLTSFLLGILAAAAALGLAWAVMPPAARSWEPGRPAATVSSNLP